MSFVHLTDNIWPFIGSFAVTILIGYSVLRIAEKTLHSSGLARRGWLIAGGFTLGASNWLLHLANLFAFQVPVSLPLRYGNALLSFSAVTVCSFIPYFLITMRSVRRMHMAAGTLGFGLGLLLMFYFSMDALVDGSSIGFNPDFVLVLVFSVFAAALTLFALFSTLRARTVSSSWARAALMGMVLALTHISAIGTLAFHPEGRRFLPIPQAIERGLSVWTILLLMLVILLLTFLNTTQARISRKEYRRLNHQTQLILRSAAEGILGLDLAGRITFCNPAALLILGCRQEEAVGLDFLSFLHSEREGEIGRPSPPKIRQTLELGASLHQKETLLHQLNGRTITIEYMATPILEKRTIGGAIVTLKDISAEKEAERRLKLSEEKYRSLVENAQDAILILNPAVAIQSWNAGARGLFGYSEAEANGLPLTELFAPDCRPVFREWLNEANREADGGGVHRMIELQARKRSGESCPVELSLTSWMAPEGRFYTAVIHDITERKRSQELYQNSEKLAVLGQLAAGIAHEIRNPLTSIRGFVQLMQMQGKQGGDGRYTDIILSELDRINFIVSEFLLLAKPQHVEFKIHDLAALVRDVITLIGTQAILNGIEIEFRPEFAPVPVYCVETHLKQVLINLLKNAIEAMPDGGMITLRLHRKDADTVVLAVQDQGIGIDPGLIAQLGEPFYTTKEKGTGLGLMVSFKIIRDHGGTIGIESERNAGTLVSLTLPLMTNSGAGSRSRFTAERA